MFTGLVEEQATTLKVEPTSSGRRITFGAKRVLDDLDIDHSIAVNGVCLTVIGRTSNAFTVEVVAETLSKTTIGELKADSMTNVERAMKLGDRLGGHLVQGHVDCTGTVEAVDTNDDGCEIWISFAPEFRRWIIPVGSICIDGVSLTVAELEDHRFKVAIIPHTLKVTTLSALNIGNKVNLEFDLIAKYIENMTAANYLSSKPAGM